MIRYKQFIYILYIQGPPLTSTKCGPDHGQITHIFSSHPLFSFIYFSLVYFFAIFIINYCSQMFIDQCFMRERVFRHLNYLFATINNSLRVATDNIRASEKFYGHLLSIIANK